MLVSLSHDKARGAVYGFDRFSSAQVYPVSQTWGYTGFLDLKLIKFHMWLQLVVWIHRMSIVPQAGVGRSAWVVNNISWSTKSARTRSAVGSNNNFAWVGFLRSSHSVRLVLGSSETILPHSFTLCERQFLQSALNSDFLIVLKSKGKQRLLSWQCLQAADDARVCYLGLISASRIFTLAHFW